MRERDGGECSVLIVKAELSYSNTLEGVLAGMWKSVALVSSEVSTYRRTFKLNA